MTTTNNTIKLFFYSLVISWLSFSVLGYSVVPPTKKTNQHHYTNANANTFSSRRDWMVSSAAAVLTTAAAAFGPSVPMAVAADASKLTTFDDPKHGFSISIPQEWTSTKSELQDRRTIFVWSDPSDPQTALFIAYTPVRDDFTSLASFGAVDQVAAQTILPKSALSNTPGVEAEMIAAESKKQAYLFDYYQSIANVQPPTHFRTIFTLQQGATGGAGAVLVTITLQAPEEKYKASLKPVFDTIIDSYGKAKDSAKA
jgi:hypothetical protein